MDTTWIRVAEDGSIVVPAEYAQALELSPGEKVAVFFEQGELRILTWRQAIERARELVRLHNPDGRSLADELIADRRLEAEKE